jgi:hypothetical protein
MGAVFLAEQIAVGHRPVALKILLRKRLEEPDFLRRFEDEADSTGRVHHPNVVTISESGQGDDGTPYIAMEYLVRRLTMLRPGWRGGSWGAGVAEIKGKAAQVLLAVPFASNASALGRGESVGSTGGSASGQVLLHNSTPPLKSVMLRPLDGSDISR